MRGGLLWRMRFASEKRVKIFLNPSQNVLHYLRPFFFLRGVELLAMGYLQCLITSSDRLLNLRTK